MKRAFLIILVLGIVSCNNNIPVISDNEIRVAIDFFMDSIVTKSTHGENYAIIPSFDAKLSEKDFLNLIDDSLFTLDDVNFMKDQYSKANHRNLKDFINKKYFVKFDSIEPKNNGQVSYYIDPPLFTLNKNRYIIYFKTFFWANNDIKWNDFYIICVKKGVVWKLEGVIKSPT